MAMDDDSRKKLQQFWRKRILMGLGMLGAVGLGVGTIEAIRSTQEKLQFSEGRALPEQFYQQQITALSKGKASICRAVTVLGVLEDERAIPALEKVLKDDRNKNYICDDAVLPISLYHSTLIQLGKFQQPEATAHLKAAIAQSPTPELIMQVMAQLEKPSNDIHSLVLQALPSLKDFKFTPSPNPAEQGTIQPISTTDWNIRLSTTEDNVHLFISNLLRSGSLDDRAIQSLIALTEDKTVDDGVLIGLVQAFKGRPKYEWLSDLLFIKMLKAGKISTAEKAQQSAYKFRILPPNSLPADSRVVDAIVDLIQTRKRYPNSLHDFLFGDLDRKSKYAKVADRIVASASTEKLSNLEWATLRDDVSIARKTPKIVYQLSPIIDEQLTFLALAALRDNNAVTRQNALHDLRKQIDAAEDLALKTLVANRFDIFLRDGSSQKTSTGYYIRLDDNLDFLPPIRPFSIPQDTYYISHREISQYLDQNSIYQKLLIGLRQALRDSNAQIRADARLILLGVIQDQNQEIMTDALQDPNYEIRHKAIDSICRLGTKKLPIIMSILQNPNADRVNMHGPALRCLISWVRDERVSQVALEMLQVLSLEKVQSPRFKLEGINIQNLEKVYADTTIEAIAFLHDRNQLQLTPTEVRQVILAILKQDQKWLNKVDPFIRRDQRIRLLKAMYDRLPADQAETDRLYLTLNLQRGLLTGFGVAIAILLVSSLRLRNPFPLIWSGYLLFPEEMVAELIALKQRRQAAGVARQRIFLELTYEVLLLLWAVHIQMRIDDLNLPPDDRNRAK
jgi:hypothetical protein